MYIQQLKQIFKNKDKNSVDYIEQLMNLVGIEKNKNAGYFCESYDNGSCERFKHECELGKQECSWYSYRIAYPVITMRKQLELIKLLGKEVSYERVGQQLDYFIKQEQLSFIEALSQIISNAISSNILDKIEVKRILKDDLRG